MAFALSTRLDTDAAAALRQSLRKLVDDAHPLTVDGSEVEQIGQACLQVLVAARRTATEQGLAFAIERPSPALVEAATLAALDILEAA
ncbi:STAS domain-containing protein [Sphingomonas adhaesiva]|uniref:STAS domain-containing protein n=1 Tax=Sphingomonas adhaesiva TaxID=28212 RepID=UPI002FF644F3